MFKGNRKWIWIIGAIVVLAGAFFFLRQRGSASEAAAQGDREIETAEVFVGDLAKSATAGGQVEAQRSGQLQFTSSGTVAEVFVSVGDIVSARDPLVQLDTSSLERAITNAEQSLLLQQTSLIELQASASEVDILAAEAAVVSAEANLASVLDGPDAEQIAAAEASLRAAQAEIAAAAARLNDAASGGSVSDIEAARLEVAIAEKAKVEAEEAHVFVLVSDRFSEERRAEIEPQRAATVLQARADLAAAQQRLTELENGDPNTIASNGASVASATANRDQAQAQLDVLLEGPTAAEIASAEASVADAKASLDQLMRGPTEAQVAVAEAQVVQAEIRLQQAQQDLADAVLVAPFAGLITAVHVGPGELASGIAIEMVDMDSLEVVLGVDEVDVGLISLGQTAVVTLESWPATEIASEVTAVQPTANLNNSGIVNFNVHLSLDRTDLPVLVGMTANANLITANREDVLLVPNAAITVNRSDEIYTVNLVDRDAEGNIITEEIEIAIGLSDNSYTQVVSGLNEGDEVVLGSLAELEENDGPGGPPGRGFNR
ncbi:MAG: HlyD family efflux transporter periplasmic adaptor subunit [Chloroflexota bacterium]